MTQQLHLAAGQAEGGDVQLFQLSVQLNGVPEHDVRPRGEQKIRLGKLFLISRADGFSTSVEVNRRIFVTVFMRTLLEILFQRIKNMTVQNIRKFVRRKFMNMIIKIFNIFLTILNDDFENLFTVCHHKIFL